MIPLKFEELGTGFVNAEGSIVILPSKARPRQRSVLYCLAMPEGIALDITAQQAAVLFEVYGEENEEDWTEATELGSESDGDRGEPISLHNNTNKER